MADKVKELGFDPDEFKKDIFALNDLFVEKILIPMNYADVQKEIYPELRRLKEKYGIYIPLSITGIDIVRLDRKLDSALFDQKVMTNA
jgi:hypothetical protein